MHIIVFLIYLAVRIFIYKIFSSRGIEDFLSVFILPFIWLVFATAGFKFILVACAAAGIMCLIMAISRYKFAIFMNLFNIAELILLVFPSIEKAIPMIGAPYRGDAVYFLSWEILRW